MTSQPIACTLTSDAMAERKALLDALDAEAVLGREPTDEGVRLRLRDAPDVERRVRELIAAEAECCPFLRFDVRREGDGLLLEIAGPPEARAVIDMF